MKKKQFYIIIVSILLAITLLLSSCNGDSGGKQAQRIEVLSGSFKIDYAIDEQLDLSNAYINVQYWDGSIEKKQITADMVSGFDTGLTNSEAQLTISYRGALVNLFYTVGKNQTAIFTYSRLLMRKEGKYLILSLNNLEEHDFGIYAAEFTLTLPKEEMYASFEALGKDCAIAKEEITDAVKILWYNSNATPLKKGADIVKVKLNNADGESVQVKSINISDGVETIRLPSKTIKL